MFRTFLIASANPTVDPIIEQMVERVAQLYRARLILAIVRDVEDLPAIRVALPREPVAGTELELEPTQSVQATALAPQPVILVGDFASAVCDKGHEADIIVVSAAALPASDGRAATTEVAKLVRQAPRPVWLVRDPARFPEHIVVGYDGSAHSGRALHMGANLAETLGARLTVLHVDESRDEVAQALILGRAAGYCEPYRITMHRVGVFGSAAPAMRGYVESNQCDLLVVGAAGLGYLRGLLFGSVAGQLIDDAPCSVLVAK